MLVRGVLFIVISALISVACFAGYFVGSRKAAAAYELLYLDDSSMNQSYETTHDLQILKVLSDGNLDVALNLAQHRYYSRIILAANIVEKRPDQSSSMVLKSQIKEAITFYKSHPKQFSSSEMQRQWDVILKNYAGKPN